VESILDGPTIKGKEERRGSIEVKNRVIRTHLSIFHTNGFLKNGFLTNFK